MATKLNLLGDYHIHTNYGHGRGLIKDNIQRAINRGLSEIAITEHGPASQSIRRLGVKTPLQLLEIKELVTNYNQQFEEINILTGVEANVISLAGDLDVPDFVLEELDIVLAGLHLWIKPQNWEVVKKFIFDNLIGHKLGLTSKEKIRYHNTQALIKAVKKNDIDIITHPGFQLDIDTVELAKACQENNTCLEINNSHEQMEVEFINAAARTGVQFVVNSDAHEAKQVGKVNSALQLLKKAEVNLKQIINVN